MANINLMTNANLTDPAVNARRVAETSQPAKPLRAEPPAVPIGQQEEIGAAAGSRKLEGVIATSEDGDTVQASEEALRELEEEEKLGRVIGDPDNARLRREAETGPTEAQQELMALELRRSEEIREAQLEEARRENEERREEAARQQEELRAQEEARRQEEAKRLAEAQDQAEAASGQEPNAVLAEEEETMAEEGQISSFIGYSDAELERMYLQGSISKFDYDQEMESRTEEREAREESVVDFSLEATDRAAQQERTQREAAEVERAFSDGANERLDVKDRAQLLQAMQRTAQPAANDPNQVAPLVNFTLG